MSTENNVKVVKNFFAAIGRGDKQALLALVADVLQKASDEVEMTYPEPPEFVAQADRVLVVGVATGKIKATNKPFEDHWVFDITIRDGRLATLREYIDTQAMALAARMDASAPA